MNSVELLTLNPKTKTTKEIIIHTLGNRWPLSAKEIHHALSREQGIDVSYQAIHKSIQELEENGAIKKEAGKYSLDNEWIDKSQSYFKSLSMAYKESNKFTSENTLKFNNYTDFPLFLGNIFNEPRATKDEQTHIYAIARHLFWPLKFSFKDFELCRSVGKNAQPHIITPASTPFDKEIQKYYRVAKWPEATIGADIQAEEDVIVQGNTIVQVSYSKETKEKIDKIYENVHNLADLFKFYMKNNSDGLAIEVKITQNEQLAKMMRENIMQKIKEARK